MGNVYWVDETNGDDSNDGLSADTALHTHQAALNKCRPTDRRLSRWWKRLPFVGQRRKRTESAGLQMTGHGYINPSEEVLLTRAIERGYEIGTVEEIAPGLIVRTRRTENGIEIIFTREQT